jgi:hypothetical protein
MSSRRDRRSEAPGSHPAVPVCCLPVSMTSGSAARELAVQRPKTRGCGRDGPTAGRWWSWPSLPRARCRLPGVVVHRERRRRGSQRTRCSRYPHPTPAPGRPDAAESPVLPGRGPVRGPRCVPGRGPLARGRSARSLPDLGLHKEAPARARTGAGCVEEVSSLRRLTRWQPRAVAGGRRGRVLGGIPRISG